MHERYLGKGYHEEIRKMLGADEEILPNRVIDADLNIGAMKMIVGNKLLLARISSEEGFLKLQKASKYILAGILCTAMMSRDKKRRKKWIKKRIKILNKGNAMLRDLVNMG